MDRVLMQQLLTLDDEINRNVNRLRRFLNIKLTENVCIITGSIAEGCSIAKWFSPTAKHHEVEIDLQYIAATFCSEDRHIVENVAGKPDNLKLKLDDTFSQRCHPDVRGYVHYLTGPYINPTSVKEIGASLAKFQDDNDTTKTVISAIFGIDGYSIVPAITESTKGTAVTLTITAMNCDGSIFARASVDNVAAFSVQFWPPHSRFQHRKSRFSTARFPYWPSREEKERIVREGCDVVPKSSPVDHGGDPNTEWRWSFSRIETQLMNSLSPEQKQVFFLVKIIFYKYIKPISSDAIHSYWVKTAMFWLCEDYHSKHRVWRNLERCVRLFFVEFLRLVTRWNIPHFFIEDHNLLRYTNAATMQEDIRNQVDAIIKDVNNFLPTSDDIQKVCQEIRPFQEALQKASQFANIPQALIDPSVDGLRVMGRETDELSSLGAAWQDTGFDLNMILRKLLRK